MIWLAVRSLLLHTESAPGNVTAVKCEENSASVVSIRGSVCIRAFMHGRMQAIIKVGDKY